LLHARDYDEALFGFGVEGGGVVCETLFVPSVSDERTYR